MRGDNSFYFFSIIYNLWNNSPPYIFDLIPNHSCPVVPYQVSGICGAILGKARVFLHMLVLVHKPISLSQTQSVKLQLYSLEISHPVIYIYSNKVLFFNIYIEKMGRHHVVSFYPQPNNYLLYNSSTELQIEFQNTCNNYKEKKERREEKFYSKNPTPLKLNFFYKITYNAVPRLPHQIRIEEKK
jgi:hypothetical protein